MGPYKALSNREARPALLRSREFHGPLRVSPLLKVAIQKGCDNVHLVAVHVEKTHETKEELDSGKRSNQWNSVMKAHLRTLSKTVSHSTDFRSYVAFEREYITARYDVHGRRSFNELKHTVFTNGVFLMLDSWRPKFAIL